MAAKAPMTERSFNLVVPLAHEATAMRTTETAGSAPGWSGAVPRLNARPGDIANLTSTSLRDYLPSVAETKATGIGVPRIAAMSRNVSCSAAFLPSGVAPYGRAGRGSRKARRCDPGTPTPFGSAHPIGVGCAVRQTNWRSHTMSTQAQGASAPQLTTVRHAFERVSANGTLLFEVAPGVPLVDALEMAGAYMASAVRITQEIAIAEDSDAIFGAHHLCQLAHAVLIAATSAAYADDRARQGDSK